MRNRFCLKKFVNREKRGVLCRNHTNFLRYFVLPVLLIPVFNGQCSKGEMFSTENKGSKILTSSGTAEITVQSNPVEVKRGRIVKIDSFLDPTTKPGNNDFDKGRMSEDKLQVDTPITDTSTVDSNENELLSEVDYESSYLSSSSPDSSDKQSIESTETDTVDADIRQDDVLPSSTSEMESLYDEDTSSKSIVASAYYDDDEFEMEAKVTPIPYFPRTGEPKSILATSKIPFITTASFIASASTPRSDATKYHYLKKVPTRLITTVSYSRFKAATTTTKRPKKVITTRSTKKPITFTADKPMKIPRPGTPVPHYHQQHHLPRDPYHPHGVVVFDKRKKRPKPEKLVPKRTTTTRSTTTSTTTSTSTTTTTTTTPPPTVESEDYFEYFWSSGENAGSNELSNSTHKNNSTSNKKRHPSKISLSKLAMAMIESSAVFENGTGSEDPLYYPKTPVNLLNILQSYTKQLQKANDENTKKEPAVQLQTSPFMMQLSQLPFGTRVAISIYYSLIAIIPLVYLAFGGLGRLGLISAFAGRGLGGQRRKRRSYGEDQLLPGNDRYRAAIIQRADLNNRNEDEFMWILGRISDIIVEFSLLSDDERRM